MPKITIKQDVLSPEYQKIVKLEGNHPSKLLKIIPEILLDVFRQQSPAIFEDQIKWDVSDDPMMFYAVWRIKDRKDSRTTVVGKIVIEGHQSQKDFSGKLLLALRCWVETSIDYNNILDKSIFWLYDKFFYKQQRMTHIEEGRKRIMEVEDRIKAYFGTLERRRTHELS